jgi:hypothetical protein
MQDVDIECSGVKTSALTTAACSCSGAEAIAVEGFTALPLASGSYVPWLHSSTAWRVARQEIVRANSMLLSGG